ncbi:glycosyltransferase family 2 protein [Echinicola sp. CAU 1574]|uniref:Glycosyltransferase family 2 protein n=1 Tax=Echinicola arenosa TaxID=2774144 RepID=A0ABR9AH71_9BACT|nr:glycosyltransferase family 2 protein [Echinicola arenosa]MBD8487295.1 glycosyltransferase family 2 protein [Echinicola arenosa]
MDKVSIIIPTFNYGFSISETLNSVLEQTHQNWECIIVDDGSTDNTSEVVHIYVERDKRFQYIKQENQGVSVARNTGIEIANGEFVQFLDGDDLLSPEKLSLQIKHFEDNPDIDISYTNNFYFRNDKPEILSYDSEMNNKEWMYKLHDRGIETVKAMLHHNIAVISSPLLKASILKKDIRFPIGVTLLEDWIFWLKLGFANCSFHYLHHPKAYTSNRLHRTSVSQKNLVKMKERDILIRSQFNMMIEKSGFDQQEKQLLYSLNKKYYKWNFKKLLYQVGPWDFSELKRINKYVNTVDFAKYYIKAIYQQIKSPSYNE